MIPSNGSSSSLQPGLTYNGFGGTQKRVDEEEEQQRLANKKTSQSLNSRVKAGKLRKFPSAGSGVMDKFLGKSSS